MGMQGDVLACVMAQGSKWHSRAQGLGSILILLRWFLDRLIFRSFLMALFNGCTPL